MIEAHEVTRRYRTKTAVDGISSTIAPGSVTGLLEPSGARLGVVVLGSVAAALWGLPLPRATRDPWKAVPVPVSVAQVGFAVWLLAAGTAPADVHAVISRAAAVSLS